MRIYKHFLLVAGFLFCTLYALAEQFQVNVNSTLNVREKPDASAVVIGTLKDGDIVDCSEVEGFKGWMLITASDGKLGYVKSSYLKSYNSGVSHNMMRPNSMFNGLMERFLTKTNTGNKHLIYWILGEVLLMWFICKFIRKITLDSITPKGVNNMAMRITFIILMLVTSSTILYYINCMGTDALWFLQPSVIVSWGWIILNFVVFMYVFINLFAFFTETVNDLSYVFRGRLNVYWGLIAWGIGVIAYVACQIFNLGWLDYIVWFELIVQGLQLLFIAYRMWRGGGIFGVLVCWVTYLIGSLSLIAFAIPLVLAALTVIAIMVVLSIITKEDSGVSSDSRNWKEWYGSYYKTGDFGYIEDFAGNSHRIAGKHHGYFYTDDDQIWDENGHRNS